MLWTVRVSPVHSVLSILSHIVYSQFGSLGTMAGIYNHVVAFIADDKAFHEIQGRSFLDRLICAFVKLSCL